MEIVWFALIALGVIVVLAAIVAAVVFLLLRLRAREPVNIDPRLLLRLYLYVAIIAGLLVFTQDAASFVKTWNQMWDPAEGIQSGRVEVSDFDALKTFGALFPPPDPDRVF